MLQDIYRKTLPFFILYKVDKIVSTVNYLLYNNKPRYLARVNIIVARFTHSVY